MRIRPRVKLDRCDSQLLRLLYRCPRRIDEQADANPGVAERRDGVRDPRRIADDVESAFSRDLLSPLGYESHLLWFNVARKLNHLGDARHLEVEIGANLCLQPLY